MNIAFEQGVYQCDLRGFANIDLEENFEDWLSEPATDNGATIEQLINFEANRLFPK